MISLPRLPFFAAFVLVVLPSAIFAGAPSFERVVRGPYTVEFTEPRIYDVSGTYFLTSLGTGSTFTIVQDAKGKLTGSGELTQTQGGAIISLAFQVKGFIKRSRDAAHLKLTLKGKGTSSDGKTTFPFTITEVYTTEIHDDGKSVHALGTKVVKACAKGFPCDRASEPVDIELHAGGGWQVSMELAQEGKKLTGMASVSLENGRSGQFSVKGKLKDGIAVLSLKPTSGNLLGKKIILEVTSGESEGEEATLEDVRVAKGSVLGQAFKAAY